MISNRDSCKVLTIIFGFEIEYYHNTIIAAPINKNCVDLIGINKCMFLSTNGLILHLSRFTNKFGGLAQSEERNVSNVEAPGSKPGFSTQ